MKPASEGAWAEANPSPANQHPKGSTQEILFRFVFPLFGLFFLGGPRPKVEIQMTQIDFGLDSARDQQTVTKPRQDSNTLPLRTHTHRQTYKLPY